MKDNPCQASDRRIPDNLDVPANPVQIPILHLTARDTARSSGLVTMRLVLVESILRHRSHMPKRLLKSHHAITQVPLISQVHLNREWVNSIVLEPSNVVH